MKSYGNNTTLSLHIYTPLYVMHLMSRSSKLLKKLLSDAASPHKKRQQQQSEMKQLQEDFPNVTGEDILLIASSRRVQRGS